MRLISLNAARFDAVKHRAVGVVGDARVALEGLSERLGGWRGAESWAGKAQELYAHWNARLKEAVDRRAEQASYAQVIDIVNRVCDENDYVLTAAGGLPAELNMTWRARSLNNFDVEFGFSCMGYEIAGGWGAKMAIPDRDVIVLVGDGSYMILNSDVYSSVLSGHKMIVVVCDNGGYAVINKLQKNTGNASFNNLIKDCRIKEEVYVDFARHADAMGASSETVTGLDGLAAALSRAKAAERTYVIVIQVDPYAWTETDAYWQVGMPEVSPREAVRQAQARHAEAQKTQRRGV